MLKHFMRHQYKYIVLFWLSYALVQGLVNGISVVDDYARLSIPIAHWKPLLWELSSQLSAIIFLVLIVLADKWFPLNSTQLFRNVIGHVFMSIAFSVLHVTGMVLLRKMGYWLMQDSYDFGNWSVELFYEYRKDFLTYCQFLAFIYIYRFIVARLIGEASEINDNEDQEVQERPKHFLVRKLGKEFVIAVDRINWIEASGNYMNLHVDNHAYPLRSTMTELEKRLDYQKFVRIHRSSIVNLACIAEIQTLESGDFIVTLNTGQKIQGSRRYKEKLKSSF